MMISRRVLIVSDRSGIRRGLREFLAATPDLDDVVEADGEGALEQVDLVRPEIILLDPYLRSPGAARRLVAAIRVMSDAAEIVVLAPSLDDDRLAWAAGQALHLGVAAATNDVADIVAAIRRVTQLACGPRVERRAETAGRRLHAASWETCKAISSVG
jgi:DNA-binding NarL/FixJ family response regulator